MDATQQARISAALLQWLTIKETQAAASAAAGRAQEGRRSSVTGGGHLAPVNQLVAEDVASVLGSTTLMHRNRAATLAGYYRATKSWDLLVTDAAGTPVMVAEFKSMAGSEGNNLNNRADEMFGIAEDARAAEEHGILPPLVRAFVFIMGATAESLRPVGASPALGVADPIFQSASYMDRMAIMLERMRDNGLYDLAWAVGVHETPFSWFEPRADVGWDRFAADLRTLLTAGATGSAPAP
jgi:hypothetical protein